MTPYIATIRRFSDAKIVLRSHNLEYLIWERMAEVSKNRAKRAYLNLLARQLKKFELSILNQIDGIAAISNEDAKKYKNLGCKIPLITIPFGIDIENYPVNTSDIEYPSLFHLGAMDWKPNIEGVSWFIQDIWPKIIKVYPDLKFYLAGRNMPNWLLDENDDNIVVLGEVDNAYHFMNKKAIMIVPLLSAGGMRVKIIEGMALNKTIISTGIGAEGINYTKGENILIADNINEFLEAIERVVSNREELDRIGKNARNLVELEYNNTKLTGNLVEFYKQLK